MKIYGNTAGLKPGQIKKLEHIYRRKIRDNNFTSMELCRELCENSYQIKRQIGVLINRKGNIEFVIVGDHNKIFLPDLGRNRAGFGRLRGVRFFHTHLNGEGLSHDDLTDLSLLCLDGIAAITIKNGGYPDFIHFAHILPENPEKFFWRVEKPVPFHKFNLPFREFIHNLEDEIKKRSSLPSMKASKENAIVIVIDEGKEDIENEFFELKELCRTAGVNVCDIIVQKRDREAHKYPVGKGKIEEIVLRSMQAGVSLLIFNITLTSSQIRAICDFTELRVIDRTQLILDIFAHRATTTEGKLQVELAQLRYILPRLREKDTALSRLTGGIGGRGPGETKLEISRRRVKDRINLLEKELLKLERIRDEKRKVRKKRELPIVSIIGYTNAGKSTLLNTLTNSNVFVEDKLFATLDPVNRRFKIPGGKEIIITDTVGFIKNLPEELLRAFKATLEELNYADIFIHMVDISNPNRDGHIKEVNKILAELGLNRTPQILALNKIDLIKDPLELNNILKTTEGIPVSAVSEKTLIPLVEKLGKLIST